MPQMQFIKRTCTKCGHEYYFQYFHGINTKYHPQYKKMVISGDIFLGNCPKCHNVEFVNHPFLYVDEDKGFIVLYDLYSKLLEAYEYDKNLRQTSPYYSKFKVVGVTNFFDMVTTITALENNLDWRVVKLALLDMQYGFIKSYVDRGKKVPSINYSGLSGKKDEHGNLLMFIDCDKKHDRYDFVFSMDAYKKCFNNYHIRLELIDPFVFDEKMREHFLYFYDEDYDTQEEHKSSYYYVLTNDGDIIISTPTQSVSEDDLVEGSSVKVQKMDDQIVEGKIEHIVYWNFLCVCTPKEQFGRIVGYGVRDDFAKVSRGNN